MRVTRSRHSPLLVITCLASQTLVSSSINRSHSSWGRFVHTGGSVIILAVLISLSGRAGLASLFGRYAALSGDAAAADAAVNLNPGDPENHFVRGALFEVNGALTEAINEYEVAIALRPEDYILWLSLSRTYELNANQTAAVSAARRTQELAPFYARPHWQLGNALVRAGQRNEGFRELALAGESNPQVLPGIIDLAWQLSGGDPESVIHAVQPQRPESFRALALYLSKKEQVDSAVAMFMAAGTAAEEERKSYVGRLVAHKQFREAYRLWTTGRSLKPEPTPEAIFNFGFEYEIDLNETGFGWLCTKETPALNLSLDSTQSMEGRSSLRVDFNGDIKSNGPVISQLFFVEPGTRYQMRFGFRTEGIVSGGPPDVLVLDATSNRILGRSEALPQTTNGWRNGSINFTSGSETTVLRIVLQREPCTTSPCPIFGTLWLDDVAVLQELR